MSRVTIFLCGDFRFLGIISANQGEPLRAAQLWGAAEALREIARSSMTPFERGEYESGLAAARSLSDEPAFAEAWAKGRGMTLEEAIAFAFE